MPATESQGSLGRPILSIRRNQLVSMEGNSDQDDFEFFQKNVADRFLDLSSSPTTTTATSSDATTDDVDNLLSIAWLRKLLDVFLCCEAEFKAISFLGRDASHINKPPLDRLIPELLDRTVKALDVCNAITHGVEMLRNWQKLAEIALSALKQSPLGEGQVRRAKKALHSLLASMTIDDKDAAASSKTTERAWSFGRRGSGSGAAAAAAAAAAAKERSTAGPPRLFTSWSVPKNWSAAKQIQAMSSNLVVPRGAEAMPVFIMSAVLVFVTWTLVVAIPCQDRNGLLTHFALPRQLSWAGPMIGLQEKIAEEWKKKKEKKSAGLLEEMQRLERCGQSLIELADSFQFPTKGDKMEEMGLQVAELAGTCRKMEEGLLPLQRQLREMFHRIVRSRTQILDVLEQNDKQSSLNL